MQCIEMTICRQISAPSPTHLDTHTHSRTISVPIFLHRLDNSEWDRYTHTHTRMIITSRISALHVGKSRSQCYLIKTSQRSPSQSEAALHRLITVSILAVLSGWTSVGECVYECMRMCDTSASFPQRHCSSSVSRSSAPCCTNGSTALFPLTTGASLRSTSALLTLIFIYHI